MEETKHGNAEIAEEAEASTEPQRTDDDVPSETTEEPSRRTVPYKADGRLYEDDLPEGLKVDTPEAEAWLKDKLSGWRGKRIEKGKDDPGLIREAVREGMKDGFDEQKPKEPSLEDDPYQLMSKPQRAKYQKLVEEGDENERFQFLVDMGLENRKAHFIVDRENKFLKQELYKMRQVQGAVQEMRMIHRMDSDFPDVDVDPEGAWDELKKPGGFYDWVQKTGIDGSVNKTYGYYLSDIGKEAGNRRKQREKLPAQETKAQNEKSKKALEEAADKMGTVPGGGAVLGRDADEVEIKQHINRHGARAACEKYGQERAMKIFYASRPGSEPRR
jgi:hypothetical protein